MCEPITIAAGITAAAAAYGAAQTQDSTRRAATAQKNAIRKQDDQAAKAKAEADAIGPAAKEEDLTLDPVATQEAKKSKIAMQQGIMGTVKTSNLSTAPQSSTLKTTLGS